MKKLLLIVAIVVTNFSCASYNKQVVNLEPTIEQIEVTGDKNELFVRANNWMVENFVDAKSVIQFSDKESGNVTGKYLLHSKTFPGNAYVSPTTIEVFAIIKIQVKDGASKLIIDPSDFTEIKMNNEKYQHLYYTQEQAKEQVNKLKDSFVAYMKNNKSNW